jgi:hypothetical protein
MEYCNNTNLFTKNNEKLKHAVKEFISFLKIQQDKITQPLTDNNREFKYNSNDKDQQAINMVFKLHPFIPSSKFNEKWLIDACIRQDVFNRKIIPILVQRKLSFTQMIKEYQIFKNYLNVKFYNNYLL